MVEPRNLPIMLPTLVSEKIWQCITQNAVQPHLAEMEDYLTKIIKHEESETGLRAVQAEAQAPDGVEQLTAFQVRGFRRDIMMYRKQPQESNRLLRILRRLGSRHISQTVLFDTGIETAVYLLYNHENIHVKDATNSLIKQWMTQYPVPKRAAQFVQDVVDHKITAAAYDYNIGLIKDMEMAAVALRTDCEEPSYAGESNKRLNPERQGAAVHGVNSDSTSSNSTHVFKSCYDAPDPSYGDGHGTTVESLIMNLGTICTDTLADNGDETTAPQPELDSTSYREMPRTDLPALALVKLGKRCDHIFEPLQNKEDFVASVGFLVGLDDCTVNLLRPSLELSYTRIVHEIDLAACTVAAKHTINACSAVTQRHINKKNTALAKLDEQADELETASSARKSLMEDKVKLERVLEKQKTELEKVSKMHEEFKTGIATSTVFPLIKVMDAIGGAKKDIRSMFRSDPRGGVQTMSDLESEITSLSNDLVATKKQLARMRSENNNLRVQLDQSRQARAELKKTISSERSSMNSKYYMDIEDRVEYRLRQSKAQLAEAEAKSQQYNAVTTDRNRLQDELQKVTCKIERQRAAKLEFDLRFRDLKEKEQATQQGYEQMCQQKHEADLRATTLETEILTLRTENDELRDSLATVSSSMTHQSQVKAVEKVDPKSPTIKIVTNQHLTDTDRLDMIARRWRKDLEAAQKQQEGYRKSLKETENQIVVAISQLEELQRPTARSTKLSAIKVVPQTNESPPLADHTATGCVSTEETVVLAPWMTMDKPDVWGVWADMD